MTPTQRPLQRPAGARRGVAAAMLIVVVAIHAAVLWRGDRSVGPQAGRAASSLPATQTRTIVNVRALAAPAAEVKRAAAAPPPEPSLPRSPPRAAPWREADTTAPNRATAASIATVTAAAAPPADPIPRYRTDLPPAITLHYESLRGGQPDVARMRWQPDAAHYRVDLMGYASEGSFDADGVAPERHTESRRGREWRAVNFQRDKGRISFSGSQGTAALAPGAQDRLSWMIQLAGVLAGEPSLRRVGSEVLMVVAGVRGEATTWRFEVLGDETLELPIGSVAATLHLRHEPALPYAHQVDVWLDPARHYLPVQLLMRRPGTAATAAGDTELRLASTAP